MVYDVIIIGAGLSGSFIARKINRSGFKTLLIEKSTIIGGRFSTKSVGEGIADYGCQYLSPKSIDLSNLIEELGNKYIVKKTKINDSNNAYIAPYGMNKIPQYLSLGINTILNQKVVSLKKNKSNWVVKTNAYEISSRSIILTMPIDQAIKLVEPLKNIIGELPNPKYESFFTSTFQSNKQISSDIIRSDINAPWICNNSQKGLLNNKNIFTINFSNDFSNKLLGLNQDQRQNMINQQLKHLGFNSYSNLSLHFWKYAFSKKQNNPSHFFDKDEMLGICGDSFSVGQADGAILSANQTFTDLIKYM
jgi:predicted NAD/FAD-dependent oxidoreductase